MDPLRRAVDQQLRWLELLCQSQTAAIRLRRWPSAAEIAQRRKEISDYADKLQYDADLIDLNKGIWNWRKRSTWTYPTLADALALGKRKRPGR